jgi:hypothetical protein
MFTINQQLFRQKKPKIGRAELLTAIRQEITERSQQSLHIAVFNTLMFEKPLDEEIPRLWNVDIKIGKTSTRTLKPTEKIIDGFPNQNNLGRVVLLGMPGSGKTTTLLELAADCCDRALNNLQANPQANPQALIPILLDLPTWQSSQPLSTWIFTQIQTKYGVSIDLTEAWFQAGELLLLLDGLDELNPWEQENCVVALNQLKLANGRSLSFVVATRLTDYKQTENRLKLSAAIGLKPLNFDQIKTYLFASRSREIWENIQDNANLLALAKQPLFLNLMALASEEILIHSWKRIKTKQERIDYLFNAYIRRQLGRQNPSQWYPRGKEPTPEQSKTWLKELLSEKTLPKNTEFCLDSLPPSLFLSPINLICLGIILILGIIYLILFLCFYVVNIGLVYGIFFMSVSGGLIALFASRDRRKKVNKLSVNILNISAVNTVILFALGILSFQLNSLLIAEAEGQGGGLLYALSLLIFIVAIAPISGLIASIYATFPWLKPLYIRFHRSRKGNIPWNYARFLEFLTERLLLQKIRDRYRLIHPLLSQHLQNID